MASSIECPSAGLRSGTTSRHPSTAGFTVVELVIVIVVLGVLSSLAVARTKYTIEQARFARAIGDVRAIAVEVQGYQAASPSHALPVALGDIDRAGLLDPWGRPYVYVNFKLGGTPRTDVFGIDLNSEYDVYSLGPDGASALSITAGVSQDDIVLGGDGGFIGRAARY